MVPLKEKVRKIGKKLSVCGFAECLSSEDSGLLGLDVESCGFLFSLSVVYNDV